MVTPVYLPKHLSNIISTGQLADEISFNLLLVQKGVQNTQSQIQASGVI